jgi:hypothetical protein
VRACISNEYGQNSTIMTSGQIQSRNGWERFLCVRSAYFLQHDTQCQQRHRNANNRLVGVVSHTHHHRYNIRRSCTLPCACSEESTLHTHTQIVKHSHFPTPLHFSLSLVCRVYLLRRYHNNNNNHEQNNLSTIVIIVVCFTTSAHGGGDSSSRYYSYSQQQQQQQQQPPWWFP